MNPGKAMFSALPLGDQLDVLFGAGVCRPVDCGEGGLQVVAAELDGLPLTVVGFDYGVQHGSMGGREADQLVQAFRHGRRESMPLVFLMNTSGVRVTEGAVGIAALRRILGAALDARLAGVRMLALIARNCFGGASVLAAACERRIVNRHCMIGMSGPRMIEYGPETALARGDEAQTARVLLGGEARAAVSEGFLLTDDDAQAYRAALLEWLRAPAGRTVDGEVLAQVRLQLRRRLQGDDRWPPAGPVPAAALEGSAAAAVRGVLGERYEMARAGRFVSAHARERDDVLLCGLLGGARADAVDVLRLAEDLADATASTRLIAILLDCESHSTRAPDEQVILSEYLAALALQIRWLHRRGVGTRLIVTGVSGGGIFAALAGAVGKVCIAADARLQVLPRAAMAAINKVEDEAEGTVARALQTGAVDAILDDCMKPGDAGR